MEKNSTGKKEIKKNKSSKSIIRQRIYVSYTFRTILYVVMFFTLFCSAILLLLNSLNFIKQKNINYVEKSTLDYKVYLKDNEFYDTPYLGKDMLYIASLIDKVHIDFDYSFASDENISLDFNYKILGQLSIMDVDEKNTYFEKEYILLDTKKDIINNNDSYLIRETVSIDYDYYNSLASKFKMAYGVDTSSKLTIFLFIDKNSVNDDDMLVSKSSYMSIEIPLSQRSINISMDYKEIDKTSYLVSKSNLVIDNIIGMTISVILIVLSMVMLIKFLRLVSLIIVRKSKYDKYVGKLLKEYDRLIVETSTCPVINGDNVIEIDRFQELLDVRDNLKLPIMYYVVNKHNKCYFYITHNNKTYLNIVKAIDLQKNKQ